MSIQLLLFNINMSSTRSTNNGLLDALAFTLATAVVITERMVVPTLLLTLRLLEDFISQQGRTKEAPMETLEMKQPEYAFVETPLNQITEPTAPKTLEH